MPVSTASVPISFTSAIQGHLVCNANERAAAQEETGPYQGHDAINWRVSGLDGEAATCLVDL